MQLQGVAIEGGAPWSTVVSGCTLWMVPTVITSATVSVCSTQSVCGSMRHCIYKLTTLRPGWVRNLTQGTLVLHKAAPNHRAIAKTITHKQKRRFTSDTGLWVQGLHRTQLITFARPMRLKSSLLSREHCRARHPEN